LVIPLYQYSDSMKQAQSERLHSEKDPTVLRTMFV